MGCSTSKQEEIVAFDFDFDFQPSIMKFYCDVHGTILDCSENVNKILQYNRVTLIGEFVGVLMTSYMSMLHKVIFEQNAKLVYNLSGKSKKQQNKNNPLLLFDIHGEPVFVNSTLESKNNSDYRQHNGSLPAPTHADHLYELTFSLPNKTINTTSYYCLSLRDLNHATKNSDEGFATSNNDVILINISIANTLDKFVDDPVDIAYVSKRFYDDIVSIITHHFYPYITIQEIVGDNFVLVLNADWTYNLPNYCATLAINFINRLAMVSQSYVEMRAGIVYGKLIYGFLGPVLRFFGSTNNMASRLVENCPSKAALTSTEFIDKLKEEAKGFGDHKRSLLESALTTEILSLKGFGDTDCCFIQLSNEREDFLSFKQ